MRGQVIRNRCTVPAGARDGLSSSVACALLSLHRPVLFLSLLSTSVAEHFPERRLERISQGSDWSFTSRTIATLFTTLALRCIVQQPRDKQRCSVASQRLWPFLRSGVSQGFRDDSPGRDRCDTRATNGSKWDKEREGNIEPLKLRISHISTVAVNYFTTRALSDNEPKIPAENLSQFLLKLSKFFSMKK